jgi:adenosine deaminase
MPDLRALPKAELHLHFEAATSPETAAELADRYGLPMPEQGPFQDLSEFVVAYERARDIVGSLEDLYRLGRELGARQREAGVVWTECHFVPATYAGRLGPDDALVEAVLEGLRCGGGRGHAGLVIGINRGLPLDQAERMLDRALRWAGRGVVALGLAGDEAHHPAPAFADLFDRAAAAGLPAVPHAGEGLGPESVRDTVDLLSPSRICHGVRAPEDPDVVRLLAERRICLDMAPTSNVLLGVVPELAKHPMPELLRAGVPVSLNSDIPLFVGSGVLEEYERCIAAWDLTDEEVFTIARTSLEHSFCPDQVRTAALGDLSA